MIAHYSCIGEPKTSKAKCTFIMSLPEVMTPPVVATGILGEAKFNFGLYVATTTDADFKLGTQFNIATLKVSKSFSTAQFNILDMTLSAVASSQVTPPTAEPGKSVHFDCKFIYTFNLHDNDGKVVKTQTETAFDVYPAYDMILSVMTVNETLHKLAAEEWSVLRKPYEEVASSSESILKKYKVGFNT